MSLTKQSDIEAILNLVDFMNNPYSNMTSFKCFESKPVVKIIYTYTHCNL